MDHTTRMSSRCSPVRCDGDPPQRRQAGAPPGTIGALAALIILSNGAARVARTVVYAAIVLLAAIGAVSLLGR